MSLALIALLVLMGLAVAAAILHRKNLDDTYKMMELFAPSPGNNMKYKNDRKKNFQNTMFIPQGSNFNTLAVSAWLLLFVATFYSFLLTPQFLDEWTFLKDPSFASSSIGFMLFGILALVAGCVSVVAFNMPHVYSFYSISKKVKGFIMATWTFLWAPILIPAYLATLYPYPDNKLILIDIGFVILIFSEFILLVPIYLKAIWGPWRFNQ